MRPRPSSRSLLAAAAAAALCGCGPGPDGAPAETLEAELALGRPVSVIVALDPGPGDAAAATAAPAGERGMASARVAASTAVWEAAKASLLAAAPDGEVAVLHRYATLPALHLEVRSRAALAALRARPEVQGVYADAANEPFLAQSLPLIGQPAAAAVGAIGAGTAVAVLDTGVDYTRAAFGACSAPGPGCRVRFAADFAPDDHALDANGHGTNVAGIVAGVAPGADLIALDVFNGQYAYTSDVLAAMAWCVEHRAEYNIVAINLSLGQGGYTGPCVDGFTAGIHAARAAGITVVAAAGNDGRADRLSSPACSAEAVSVGAVYDSDLGGIAYPGCTDAATAADAITCFSNSSRYLSLLAPGAIITAAGVSMVGTSQAAPHVAGALAVLRAATPGMTGDAAVASLKATGKRIADRRNGVVTPRVDLSGVTVNGCPAWLSAVGTLAGEGGAATASLSLPPSCPWTASSSAGWLQVAPVGGSGAAGIALTAGPNLGASRSATVTVAGRVITVTQDADRTPPTGSVTLVGAPPVQRTLGVTLALTAADVTGVPSMCLSNGPTCSAWEPFAATRPWTLASGPSGVRTVHVRFRDGAGNVSADLTRSIAYDVTPPVGGVLAVEVGDGRVDLRWSGFQDPGSGVVGLRLVRDTPAVPAAGCRGGTVLYTGLGGAYADLAVENGVTYHYRLCAVDGLGNVSPGIVRDARPSAGRGPAGGRTQG